MYGSTIDTALKCACTRFDITSTAACVAPRYGMCTTSMPVAALNASIATCCGLPLPPEE